MSYDISLHVPSERRLALEEGCFEPKCDPDPALEARKRRVAARLIEADPRLSVFELGFAEIAEAKRITVEEARSRYRHLELNGADDGNGIQLTLYDRAADITMPFWHTGPRALEALRDVWTYLRILVDEGFVAHDPQLGRTIDLKQDFEAVLKSYAGGVEFTREAIDQIKREQRERN